MSFRSVPNSCLYNSTGPRDRSCHNFKLYLTQVCCIILWTSIESTKAQSIGYHPNYNLGFNPYLSPVHGYGLGVAHGAYGESLIKNPLTAMSLLASGNNLAGKLHAKKAFKKLTSHPFGLAPYQGSLGNKLTLLKHPEYKFTPYGADYGFGKHYGSANVPNNPYNSAYGHYYQNNLAASSSENKPALASPSISESIANIVHHSFNSFSLDKTHALMKPLIKTGALLTAAALLGKKKLEVMPMKLNPAGMILSPESINLNRNDESTLA